LSLSFWLSHRDPICFPFILIRTTCSAHPIQLDLIILIIFGEEHKLLSSLLCNFISLNLSCNFVEYWVKELNTVPTYLKMVLCYKSEVLLHFISDITYHSVRQMLLILKVIDLYNINFLRKLL
jgi:hypothetical protein